MSKGACHVGRAGYCHVQASITHHHLSNDDFEYDVTREGERKRERERERDRVRAVTPPTPSFRTNALGGVNNHKTVRHTCPDCEHKETTTVSILWHHNEHNYLQACTLVPHLALFTVKQTISIEVPQNGMPILQESAKPNAHAHAHLQERQEPIVGVLQHGGKRFTFLDARIGGRWQVEGHQVEDTAERT